MDLAATIDGKVGTEIVGPFLEAFLYAYIDIVYRVDQGKGVYITLNWGAILIGQYWLRIPTPVSVMTGAITVRRSNGEMFIPNEDWTNNPYFDNRGTFFADMTGDGKEDAIVVNVDSVTVRRSTGNGFGPNEDFTHGPYYSNHGTFFADVDGDGKADAIVSNSQ
jgi:hypothetical protein